MFEWILSTDVPASPSNAKEAVRAGTRYAQCISSDDPRSRDK